MRLRPAAVLLPPLALALVLAGCASRPPARYFQPTADQMGPEPNSYGEVVIPRHGLVVVQGDEMAYGLASGRSRRRINDAPEGQSAITVSETLRRAVKGVRIENRGFPGDTVELSAHRWADAPRADLAILCFGFGDAQAQTSLQAYSDGLRAMIEDLHARGTAVFVVTPPTLSDILADGGVSAYRQADETIGRATGAVVFRTDDSIGRIKAAHVKTLAQPPAVYQAVAADMAAYIKVLDAPSPQVGQAGSGDRRTVRVSPASAS